MHSTDRLIRTVLATLLLLVPLAASAGGSDPLRSEQWGLRRIKAPRAWTVTKGKGALVAIVDTGVDFRHPDLKRRLVPAAGGDLVERGDSCPGVRTASPCSGDGPQDANGHGSHVAGIVAAPAGNGKGVAGVAPKAKLLAVRVLDADGSGDVTDVADGIRYATRRDADVINLSLEVSSGLLEDLLGGDVQEVEEAIDTALDQGVVVVVAAGNASTSVCNEISDDPRVVCVGSIGPDDRLSDFSNSDGQGNRMYLVAPGGDGSCAGDIWSTVWRRARRVCPGPRGYDSYSGTSMAAPHVSGVVALLVARGLETDAILDCLRRTAQDLGEPGRDATYGYGVVNAAKAVRRC